MKTKYLITLLIVAFMITSIGALFKILHWNYGNEMLLIGVITKLFIGITLIIKLLTTKKFKEFLNW